MLLVCRFVVAPGDVAEFVHRAGRALELLTAAAGSRGGELGRAVDGPQRWVLTVRFETVHAYRRALAPFEVREHVVPLLSEAETDWPSTHETLLAARDGTATTHESLLTDPP